MTAHSAVIFVPNPKSGQSRPMMLQHIMGTPLLTWLAASLSRCGVKRCFLICHKSYLSEVQACFPEEMALTCAADQNAADLLHVFLSTAEDEEDQVLVVTSPVVCLPGTQPLPETLRQNAPSGVCTVSREIFMSVLDEKFSLMAFLNSHGTACSQQDGFYAVAPCDLPDWQPILKRVLLHALTERGVEIWDYDNCYIEPSVRIGKGTVLLPGTILRGKTVIGTGCTIGPNCLLEDAVIGDRSAVNASQIYRSSIGSDTTVGPFAYVRPDCRIGSHIRLGDFVEVKNSVIGDGTKVSHLTYVGDSDVGKNVNFGCGTVTVNYDRAKKFRTVIEDDSFIGCNTNLIAPVTVGKGAYIGAGSTITENVPPQALGIARARQSNKKDWATKHKIKEK